eukprot:g13966.t1
MGELVLARDAGAMVGAAVVAVGETILAGLESIGSIGRRMRENKRAAADLLRTAESIQPQIREIRRRATLSSSETLDDLLGTVYIILDAVDGYSAAGAFKRAKNSKKYAKKFERLNNQLTQRMYAVTLADMASRR